MRSSMCVDVEFLAGTDIESAIKEAKLKAEKWDVAYVKFNFNGASFSIGRNADVHAASEEYMATHGKPYGICHS
jgi:hypothetical protein